MGLSQAKFHKRKKTGGRFNKWRKKRRFEAGKPASMTKLAAPRQRRMRVMGGNWKTRALRLDMGSFSWPSERCTRRAKILDVVYNASNNELVRTKTIVKNCILKIDATPFKSMYQERYAIGSAEGKDFIQLSEMTATVTPKKEEPVKAEEGDAKGKDKSQKKPQTVLRRKMSRRMRARKVPRPMKMVPKIDPVLRDCMRQGFAFACVRSRPGQVGKADGYILEGKELDFYKKKMDKKKQK